MSEISTLEQSLSDWNRTSALEEIENLKNIRTTAWDEHTHSFRWLMASLSAINAGACLSIFDNEKMDTIYTIVACSVFGAGVIFALLVAVFGQYSVQGSLMPLQRQIGYWMTVARDGERDENFEAELANDFRKASRIGIAARISGWLAALAFIIGGVVVGNGMLRQDSNTKAALEMPREAPKLK